MNLMIIEDEVDIRQRLVQTIPWEDHGIHVAAEVGDGLDAWRMVERVKPDLLLLDIRLPGINGLDLAAKIRETEKDLKIIILSGHDDFEYARASIDIGVSHFLLKPAGNDEVMKAVLNAAGQLQSERAERHERHLLETNWEQYLPKLKAHFYESWMNGHYTDWQLKQQSEKLGIRLADSHFFAVVVFEMDPLEEAEVRFSKQDTGLLQFSLYSITEECLRGSDCFVLHNSYGSILALFHSRSSEHEGEFQQRINFLAVKVLSVVKDCLKLTASAGIGSVFADRSEAIHSLRLAKRALLTRVVYGHHLALHHPDLQLEEDQPSVWFQPASLRSLTVALDMEDEEHAMKAMEELIGELGQTATSAEIIQEQVLLLSSLLTQSIHTRNWSVAAVLQEDAALLHHLSSFVTREQIASFLRRIVRKILAFAAQRRNTGSSKLIQDMLHLIEEHIDMDISLQSMANRFYINSSYLSRLFKHNMKKSYSDYVMERKMLRARQHLIDGSKVHDAARMVGYINVGFFSKQFQKYWGVVPSEMRGLPG
ncbi:MAG: AraC family transcriptional regulator [Paenibacillus sp.]|jgi:two-component system response regulator YesN|nr:AraC family transcriptional regulator [Paenibacillus sp.]